MNRKLISSIFLLMMILFGCEKNIVISTQPYTSQLSVECILAPGKVPVLYLGNTVGYFEPLTTPLDLFVDNALVMITSDNHTDTLTTESKYNYFRCQDEFFYQGKIPIVQGQSYHLRIEHDGKVYEADTRTDVAAIQVDSVSYISAFSDFYGEHEGVVVSFSDAPNQKNYYRYRMDRILQESNKDISNCAVGPFPATEMGRSVYYDTNIDGAPLKIVIEPAFQHAAGDTADVYLQTLDAASAQFYSDLDRQKSTKVNPFIEPVFITSNISGAFGIFGASNFSMPVKFTFPE